MRTAAIVAIALVAVPATPQVDQARAALWFREAQAACERDNGRLWGISLCGPMVIADASTKTIATNQPAPDAPRPAALGFANAAMNWGGTRWSTFMWATLQADERDRLRVMIHELFHRIQPQLGLLLPDDQVEHLDTTMGRYWMRLEWRALRAAVQAGGRERETRIADALAFRQRRRSAFPGAAERERVFEINEGLAQYTGTVVASVSATDAIGDAAEQLRLAEQAPTFVRTFPYPSGAAYGMLLDAAAPGWPRRIRAADDLGTMLEVASGVAPAPDADAAATRYGGPALMAAEEARTREREAVIAALRKTFVTGPLLVLPGSRNNSFTSAGMTPIPGEGMVYPTFRATAEWGTLEADRVLVAPDRSKLTLPAPTRVDGSTIIGDGYVVTLAPGWTLRSGPRPGDFQVVKS